MSRSLPTEMTIRNFLTRELEKRAIKVYTEWSYTTPTGRLVPDMRLLNGAEYVVETKLGAESKLLEAIVQLYDYSKYTEAKGAFAILFPEELRRPWTVEMLDKIAADPKLKYIITAIFKDNRPSQRFVGNLAEVADYIAAQVLKPLVVEADTGFAIKVLTEAVESLTLTVKSLRTTDLEEIFGGKTVFENILQYEEGRYPLEEMRQAATYLLVNQIIFYHVLSRAAPREFDAIDESKITKPSDLLRYFEHVLKKDYASVFGFDVVSKLPEFAIDIIKRVTVAVKALAPEKIGHDVLGKVFHELIPFNIRKSVAAFYTNNEAAEILANLAITKPDATVLDLACGSGTLLVAAYRRKRELLQNSGTKFSLEDHRRFLEHDLTGVDIMPFAAHLAVMHLSLQALLSETEKVRIAVWDSTELKPGMNIPAIYSELKAAYKKPTLDMFGEKELIIPEDARIKKGAITLEGVGGEEIPLEKVDLVIMNPPFTRQERLPKEYKIALQNRFKDYKDKLSGRLGLHGYFVFLADKFVKTDGRVAFVLPATTLRITSTKGVRETLSSYELEHIVTTYQKAAFSEGAQFREILLIAKKTKNKRGPCLFVFIKKLPANVNEAKDIAAKLRELRNRLDFQETYNSEILTARKVEQTKIRENLDNLFRYIASENLQLVRMWETIEEKAKNKLLTFSSALEKLGGKIVEGARARSHLLRSPIGSTFIVCDKDRAAKKDDLWVVKDIRKETVTAENIIDHALVQIPRKSLEFGLRRFSGVDSMDLSNKLDYIVVDKFSTIEKFFQSRDIKKILNDLPHWRQYIRHRMAKLVIADRFDMSATGTKLLAWYSSKPMAGYSLVLNVTGLEDEDAKIFTIWFNSTINALQIFLGRIETRGAWMAFRQYVMSSFFVINPADLSKSQRQRILKTFDAIKDVTLPSFLEQLKQSHPIRRQIDTLILEIIGIERERIESILHDLYPALANEIEKLKTLMAG